MSGGECIDGGGVWGMWEGGGGMWEGGGDVWKSGGVCGRVVWPRIVSVLFVTLQL